VRSGNGVGPKTSAAVATGAAPHDIRNQRWSYVVNPPTEVRPVLVSGSVFKTDGAPRKRALGGFDSRALPLP
jgi:hypothetical protein